MNLLRRFHYLLRRDFLEEKFKEREVPNTPAHHLAQKYKGLPDLHILCRTHAELHNAEHYNTILVM